MSKREDFLWGTEMIADNLLIIHDKKLAERYIKNWQEHAGHSEVYAERGR